jgi:hypothetical protein
MRVRAKSIVRFDAGLDMRLHAKCRKSVAKFRTALFEVLTWLKVMPMAFHDLQTSVLLSFIQQDPRKPTLKHA